MISLDDVPVRELDAARSASVEHDPGDCGVGSHHQIAAVRHGFEIGVGRAHPTSVTARERDASGVGRGGEQRPVERTEFVGGGQFRRDHHAGPRSVDIVPAPGRIDRRITPQRHHRVDGTGAAETAAAHVRERDTTGRASGHDAGKRAAREVDCGEEVAAADRGRRFGIVGRTRLDEDHRAVGVLAQP